MKISIVSRWFVVPVFAAAMLLDASVLRAQPAPSGPPNALQGFSQNRDKPIKINSATLEVRDKDKVATFSGDVHLVQGDTTLRSKILVVFYDEDAAAAAPAKPPGGAVQAGAAQGGPAPNQQIRRVEAKGNVIVVQKDQTATGENGIFDMRANTVTLLGSVVISQGQNVVKGDKLTVDMTSGDAKVECEKAPRPCRVSGLFTPGSMKPDSRGPGASTGTTPTPAHEAPRQRSSNQPSGLY
jgi:lipopolysaccharide export system protein LptA